MYKGSFTYIHETTYGPWEKASFVPVTTKNGVQKLFLQNRSLILNKEEGAYYLPQEMVPSSNQDPAERTNLPFVNRLEICIPAEENEHFYGLGETFACLDLKGQLMRVWVAEHQNEKRIEAKIAGEKEHGKTPHQVFPLEHYETYYAQPTLLSSKKRFFHIDSTAYMEFDFRAEGKLFIRMNLEDGKVPFFATGEGATFDEVSGKLTWLLERPPLGMPDWTLNGVILAVQRGAEEVDSKIETALSHGIKTVGIWSQDWCGCRKNPFGYQVMWNWRYDTDLYPDLPAKIREWNQKGIQFLGYINPFIALERELYTYASKHGYCVKAKDGSDYLVTITHFPAAMIDFTNPEAYDWYKSVIKENMLGIGMKGWMADFGEYLPVDACLYNGDKGEKWHNAWPAIWAQLNREAIQEYAAANGTSEGDYLFFTRAGFTGTIAAGGMMWTGDQHVDFSLDDGLASVIPATLSLAACGHLLTHSDVGGYTTKEGIHRSKELLMRWEEMNVFSPLMRFHEGNQPWNNIQFDGDEEVLAHLAKMSKLHVALKPYLTRVISEAVEKGLPVMRPLFYYYDEEKAFTERFEYLLGRDLLIAPVLDEGATVRQVYLPEDEWIHFFTGDTFKGGFVTVNAPIGMPPVFVRKDADCAKELRLMQFQE